MEHLNQEGLDQLIAGRPAHSPGPSSRATLTSARIGQLLVLRLAGELDLESAAILREASLEDTATVLLDLSHVDFCDSMGLNVLLRLRAEAEERGIQVHLAAPSRQVAHVLEITGADRVFLIHADVDDVMAAQAQDQDPSTPI